MTCVQRNPQWLQASTGTRTAVHQLPSLLAFRSTSFPQSSSLSAVWQTRVTSMHALCLCLSVCASLPPLSFSLSPSSVRPQEKVLQGLPSKCSGCLFHPSLSDFSSLSHLIFPVPVLPTSIFVVAALRFTSIPQNGPDWTCLWSLTELRTETEHLWECLP